MRQKTIKPVDVGGYAGGEKYITQGILFKFAVDWKGLYGGDEYSMKAASHELTGLMSYYKCAIPGLHYPLMCLIDYKGFRLIAMSILPGIGSVLLTPPVLELVYGSGDGGHNVFSTHHEVNLKMAQAAKLLNLKPHVVGSRNQVEFLFLSDVFRSYSRVG